MVKLDSINLKEGKEFLRKNDLEAAMGSMNPEV